MGGQNHTHLYVVCRIDGIAEALAQGLTAPEELKTYFMVTKVFHDPDQAEQEVIRLNDLAKSREVDSFYFWQVGRVPID
jgi:hypothetical protein